MTAPGDELIRAVIEAWLRAGELMEGDGSISAYVCERVREEMRAAEAAPAPAQTEGPAPLTPAELCGQLELPTKGEPGSCDHDEAASGP